MSEIIEVESALPAGTGRIEKPERWKSLVIILILINTLLVSAVAGLQVDADIRTKQANTESQYNAILASSELNHSSIQGIYDLNTYAQNLVNQQTALVLQYSALQQQMANDDRGYQDLMAESAASQARADQAKALSVLLTDPRYAPSTEVAPPNTVAYMKDLYASANALVEKQNAASDRYHLWNNKADSYVAVLTALAVAFFLLGIAQSVSPRLRLLFSGVAMVVMAIGSLWALIILIR
jgi:hypothetical protein